MGELKRVREVRKAGWNYVSVYRWATDDEMIQHELEGDTLMVVSIMSNLELATYLVANSD